MGENVGQAAKKDEYSGETGSVGWRLADNPEYGERSQLILWPNNGSSGVMGDWNFAPWLHQSHKIVSVVVRPGVKAVTLKSFLCGCKNLKHVDISNLDTSSVANMSNAFADCSSIEQIDLSSWNAGAVRSLKRMFAGCQSLKSINLSGWRLVGEIEFNGVFNGCDALRTLDIRKWTEPSRSLFKHLAKDAYDCDVITYSLDNEESGNLASTIMAQISIQSTSEPAKLASSSNVIEQGSFNDVVWRLDGEGRLVVEPANGEVGTINRWGLGRLPWHKFRSKIKSVVVRPGVKAKRLDNAFEGFRHLTDADLSGLDASELSSIAHLFNQCHMLKSVNLKGWSSEAIENTTGAFWGCTKLESVNLEGCNLLTANAVSEALKHNNNCKVIRDIVWSGTSGGVIWKIAKSDSSQKPGQLMLAPVNGSFGEMENWGQGVPPWHQASRVITEVLIKPGVKAATMENIFKDCCKVCSFNLSNLDSSDVCSMANAFSGCSELLHADLSALNTSKLADISGLFADCPDLLSVDLSGWNASGIQQFDNVFDSRVAGAAIDVRNWNSSSVKRLDRALPEKLKGQILHSLEEWEWDVPIAAAACGKTGSVLWWVTNSARTFDSGHMYLKAIADSDGFMGHYPAEAWREHAGAIRKLTVFKGVKARSLDFAFSGLKNLTSVELSELDVSRTESFSMMFAGCENLEVVNLSAWKTSRLKNADGMFSGCRSLKSVSIDAWDISNLETAHAMFSHCESLQEVDLSSWNAEAIGDCSYMFEGCSSLASLDLTGWDFGGIEHYEKVFEGCSSVKHLALSYARKNAPGPLLGELICILPDAVEWLEEPPFAPGDRVLFGMTPQVKAQSNALSWTVLESSKSETTLLCNSIVDSCCSGIMSTSIPIERYEELLTRDFNHFCFSKLEKESAGGAIKVSVPRVGTLVSLPDAARRAASPNAWALRRGVARDAQGHSFWLAYDDVSQSWGQGSISNHPEAIIQSTPLSDCRRVGLRPVVTVANLRQSSASYWNSRRNIARRDLDERFSVGDTLTLGVYPQNGSVAPIEWIVTDKADGKMLLVSKKILETEEIANGSGSLEQWMNEDFFVKAFCCLFDEEGQWLSNAAYEEDIKGCNVHKSLVFSLTHVDYDCYKDVIGIPETTRYAIDNGVCVDGGRADWRLFRTWYVWAGKEKSPKGIRPAIQVDMKTGEIVPRVLHPDYENLSFPYRFKAEAPDFDSAMSESILTQAGYHAQSRNALTAARRQAILLDLVKRKVISKNSIIKHLKRNIALHQRHDAACARWQEDINYLNNLWRD